MRAALVLFALLTLGCAADDAPMIDGDGLRPPASSGKADGIGPEAFFHQFRYSVVEAGGYYDSGEPKWTRHAGSYDSNLTLETDEGARRVDFDLWMLDDGVVYAEYEELARIDSSTSEVVVARIERTEWRVEGEELIIEGVGRGIATESGEHPVIDFQFERDLGSAGLAGLAVTLFRVSSTSRLEHVERDYAAQGG